MLEYKNQLLLLSVTVAMQNPVVLSGVQDPDIDAPANDAGVTTTWIVVTEHRTLNTASCTKNPAWIVAESDLTPFFVMSTASTVTAAFDCSTTLLEVCTDPRAACITLVDPMAELMNEDIVTSDCCKKFNEMADSTNPDPEATSISLEGNGNRLMARQTRSVEYVGYVNSYWLELHTCVVLHTRFDVTVDPTLSYCVMLHTVRLLHTRFDVAVAAVISYSVPG